MLLLLVSLNKCIFCSRSISITAGDYYCWINACKHYVFLFLVWFITFFLLSMACWSQTSSMVRVFLWRRRASGVWGTSCTRQYCWGPVGRITNLKNDSQGFLSQLYFNILTIVTLCNYIEERVFHGFQKDYR